jgi:hypothetical protein
MEQSELCSDGSFAHDGSIAPLLGLLQIDEVSFIPLPSGGSTDVQPVWPGMGSEVGLMLDNSAIC